MAKVNKEYKWRMEGMLYALKIAEEQGVEALRKEIKTRGILKLDIWADSDDMAKMYRTFNVLQKNMTATSFLMALRSTEKFGEERLHRVWGEHEKNMKATEDICFLGKHYVTFSDYAKFLNENFNFDFDVTLIEAAEEITDGKDTRIGKPDVKVLVSELEREGFTEAANWIKDRMVGRY